MHHRPLGRTGLSVSVLSLGTMTFGEQTGEADAHAVLDRALDHGINFIDTAEMYPIPPLAETQGRTEAFIGSWLAARRCRERVVLATKVVAPGGNTGYFRDGTPRLDRRNIRQAVADSLRRLRTDYIDLYYLHWPERYTNCFGKLGYVHAADQNFTPLDETLAALGEVVAEGLVRHVGVSNETPWGLMTYLHLAETRGLPRMACIQNPYHLLNRAFEVGLAEIAIREECGLCAYSPLAFGVLTGKYLGGARPAGARLTRYGDRYPRYQGARAEAATAAYVELARRHGLSPAHLALAFVTSRPFVTSAILGVTTPQQLEDNVASLDVTLTPDLLAALEEIHRQNLYPCP